ncbi:hypothetical protein [Palaeococcus sp. (in: euryarchaeotes)]
MRKIVSLLIILFVSLNTGLVLAEGVNYPVSSPNNQGIYLYFGSLLSDFNSLLDSIIRGENDTIQKAVELYGTVNVTYEALITYSSYDIDSKGLETAPYFKELGEGAFRIASYNTALRYQIERGEYVSARQSLFLMKMGLNECYDSLDHIGNIKFVGGLEFDLKDTYARLEDIKKIVERYEAFLSRFAVPENFSLSSSNLNPKVYENVSFYGYTLGLEEIRIFVNGSSHEVKIANGNFYLEYSFKEPGVYRVYALGVNGSKTVKSNELVVNVTKVPTSIIASERTGEGVIIEGYLMDYFGNGVPHKRIEMYIGNGRYYSLTDRRGSFNITIGNISRGMNATIIFQGDNIYNASNTTLFLTPAKDKPVIRLFYEKDRVKVGDDVIIKGTIYGDYTLPLTIYIDNEVYSSIKARNNFTITLRLKEGKHKVYAYFGGNERLAPSMSNILSIEAVPIDYSERLLLLAFFILLSIVGYKWITKSPKDVGIKKRVEREILEPKFESQEEPDISRAYRIVYNLIIRVYRFSKSMTPREILTKLKREPFARDLEVLTSLHERYVYGKRNFGVKDALSALKHASRIIVGIFVRDEL